MRSQASGPRTQPTPATTTTSATAAARCHGLRRGVRRTGSVAAAGR